VLLIFPLISVSFFAYVSNKTMTWHVLTNVTTFYL